MDNMTWRILEKAGVTRGDLFSEWRGQSVRQISKNLTQFFVNNPGGYQPTRLDIEQSAEQIVSYVNG